MRAYHRSVMYTKESRLVFYEELFLEILFPYYLPNLRDYHRPMSLAVTFSQLLDFIYEMNGCRWRTRHHKTMVDNRLSKRLNPTQTLYIKDEQYKKVARQAHEDYEYLRDFFVKLIVEGSISYDYYRKAHLSVYDEEHADDLLKGLLYKAAEMFYHSVFDVYELEAHQRRRKTSSGGLLDTYISQEDPPTRDSDFDAEFHADDIE